MGTPALAVRTRLPLAWRLGAIALLLTLLGVAGLWLYEAGGRFAGFDRNESEGELARLRAEVRELEKALEGLRVSAGASASTLQIERTAQERLAGKLGELEAENAHLKQELAFFDSLAESSQGEAPVSINRLEVQANAEPGDYRYRLLVVLHGGKLQEFSGSIQLVVSFEGRSGPTKLVLPRADDPDIQRFRLHFRHFRRVDGSFRIPQTAKLTRIEVRLIQEGSTKASRSLVL